MWQHPTPEVVSNPGIGSGEPMMRDYPYLPHGTMAAVETWARVTGHIVDATPERPWRRFARI